MLWLKKEPCFMIISVLMLVSSAFHLETSRKGKSVQYGGLLIGSSGTTNEAKDGIVKKLYPEYAGDNDGYQSDQPGREWSQWAKLRLQRLSPSVRCDDNSMTLCLKGSQVPNFLVETSEEGPLPLSQMPSHCGFSVKRARRDVSLVAKYDCCNVGQQGDTYILPLRILGVAVEMVCPVARPLAMVSCSPSAMVVNLGMSPDAVRLKVNGSWQSVNQASVCGFTLEAVGGGLALSAPYTSNCWQFKGAEMVLYVQYMDAELTLSCPAVPLPATTLLPAKGKPGTPTVASKTTSTTTTSTTQATTVVPASADQQASPQQLPPVYYPYAYYAPWYFPYSQVETPLDTYTTTPTTTSTTHTSSPTTTAATTTPTTTVAPASADQQALPHWLPAALYPYPYPYPYGYRVPWYFPYSQQGILPAVPTTAVPTTAVPTTAVPTTAVPTTAVPTTAVPTTAVPTTIPPFTTVAQASADQQALPPLSPGPYKPSGYGIPWYLSYSQPGVIPSSPLLPGMFNPYNSIASPGVPVSGGSNSGVKPQMYQLPWMTSFNKYPMLNQKSGPPFLNPSKAMLYPAYSSPLQVKHPGK